MAVKSSRVSVYQREMAGDADSLLKDQYTKSVRSHFLPLGSGRERAEWTTDAWGESGSYGSRERTEGTAARIPVPSCLVTVQGRTGSLWIWAAEENSQSCWDVWHAVILGWGDQRHHKPCVTLCVPLREVPTPYILHVHSRVPKYCIAQRDSAHVSPLKVMGTVYQVQSVSRVWEHCLS